MKSILESLRGGRELDTLECNSLAETLLDDSVKDASKAELLKALAAKGETSREIAGLVEAFLVRAVDPQIERLKLESPTLDIVGTGGDRLNLFNVSTTSMFVAAGAGAIVTKHGNRSVSSMSGGADVLEALGVRIDMRPDEFCRAIEKCGVGFLFAPIYHPAFKAVVEVRKQLAAEGVSTVFNLLGPLLNPAKPSCQLIGVNQPELTLTFAEIAQRLGRDNVWVVHGETEDGESMDELSLSGPTFICKSSNDDEFKELEIEPEDFDFEVVPVKELVGGDAQTNAKILTGILDGSDQGPRRDMVLLNSGAAIVAAGLEDYLDEGIAAAREAIDSGKALKKLKKLQSLSK